MLSHRNRERLPILPPWLKGTLQLLSSGTLGAIGLSLLASRRLPLASDLVTRMLLFVHWETLGLTVAKAGADQVAFAIVSNDRSVRVAASPTMLRAALPLAAAIAVMVSFAFGFLPAMVLFFSIALDVFSTLLIADNNARGRFAVTASANLLNYPAFFILLFALFEMRGLSLSTALLAFMASSGLRAGFLLLRRERGAGLIVVQPGGVLSLTLQQSLNYLLFRADQLFLGFWPSFLGTQLQSYLFMSKLPELGSGFLTLLGPVLLPSLRFTAPRGPGSLPARIAEHRMALLSGASVLTFAGIVYLQLGKGMKMAPPLILPFFVHLLLILPVNSVTYSMLAGNRLSLLLGNLAWSTALGFLMIYFSGAHLEFFYWIVPLQLLCFLSLSSLRPWGDRSDRLPGAALKHANAVRGIDG